MSFINSLLNVFVGNKSKKDLKEVESIVKNILSHENDLNLLNHNELRNKTKKI
jgi:preprotein translocase subunit SecA